MGITQNFPLGNSSIFKKRKHNDNDYERCKFTFTVPNNSFQPNVAFPIKTRDLFCRAKQMTGFYMKHNGLKWVNF